VSQQELMGAVVEQARQFPGQEQQVVEFYQKNPNHIEELRGPIFEDKVVDYIFDKVKTKEKKVTLEELVQLDLEDDAAAKKPAKKASAKKAATKDEKPEAAEKADAKKPAAKKTAAKK
jgi:trigger factor